MARPRVGGLRTTRDSSGQEAEPSALPDKKSGLYQFRSRASALRYSVKRRRIERGPEGDKEEVVPRTKDDAALDWVLFENNYFETPSRELAEALIAKVKSMGHYGVGQEVWSLEDEKTQRDAALERELRARIESSPEIAARMGIALPPSNADDIKLPTPVS